MTWNIRDTIPRTPKTGRGAKVRQGTTASQDAAELDAAVTASGHGARPVGMPPAATAIETSLPTFASVFDLWDDETIVVAPPEVQREWNDMGLMTDRQWQTWAQLCRRGIHEI